MNGSECSTGRNPLAQFTKHTAEDRSLQYDRVGSPAAGPQGGIRSNVRAASAEDQQLMDQFKSGGLVGGNATRTGPFHMEQMRNELNNMPHAGNRAWANDFKNAPMRSVSDPKMRVQQANNGPESARWATEFHQAPVQPAPATTSAGGSSYARMGMSGQVPRFVPQMSPMYQNNQYQMAHQTGAVANDKIVALDDEKWEEQFKAIEQEVHSSKGKEKLVGDEDLGRAEVVDDLENQFDESEFENVWSKVRDEVLNGMEDMDTPAWEKDFGNFTSARPQYGDYQFEESSQNPFLNEDNPFATGVELMDSGAKLSSAVLCFEAAVQKDPNHVDAWARLGAAQAQNEKEDPAIRAMERCIQLDPSNLDALMYLSVSYTNEGYENAAYATLEKWLATKYPAIVDQARNAEPRLENEDRFQLHGRVTELFIRAAQLSPAGANMDADVQVGLGVLFYGSEEYDKAIDCFQAALDVRPDDFLLWNRLGATLANSNKSEEAIEAYHRALSLRPSFVRARFNLGVSCINIGCYKEAAQHLLSALSLHEVDGPPDELLANQSSNLYETLRRVLMAMERLDLMEKVGPEMNLDEFRQYFDF